MEINKNKFLNDLKKLNYATSNKTITEEFKCVYFDKKNMITTNGKILILSPFETDFSCYVFLEKLLKYLEKVKTENIKIDYKEDNLILKSNNSELILNSFKNETGLFKIKKIKNWEKIPSDFYKGLQYSLLSTTAELNFTHEYINYIFFIDNKLFSTNNKKLSEYTFNKKFESNFCIYNSIIEIILNIPNIEYYKKIENFIVFKTKDNLLIYCRYNSISHPNYESIIKLPTEYIEIDFLNGLSEGLNFCNILNSDLHNNDKNILFEINKNKLICSTQTEKGKINFNYKLKKEYKQNISFILNPFLLNEIIKQEEFKCYYDYKEHIYFFNDKYKFVTLVRKNDE